MLNKVFIDGFKSLRNFEILFCDGLNVLIGPNGAGKSNICSAVNLLSHAMTGEIVEYIISLGGTDSIFSKCEGCEKKITLRCDGEKDILLSEKKNTLRYNYEILIFIEDNEIKYKEKFSMYALPEQPKIIKRYIKVLEAVCEKNEVRVDLFRKEMLGPIAISSIKKSKEKTIKISRSPDRNVFLSQPLGSYFYYCYKIFEDIGAAKVWNINPSIARLPSDIIEDAKMQPNGKGLANLLHMLKSSKKEKFVEINTLLKRVLPGFVEISISNEPQEYKRTLGIKTNNNVKIPSTCLSDGTVKMLGLVSGIVGQNNSLVIIEELENYLHPWACTTLIDYLRDISKNRVIVVTTHSETILNALNPKEIIVVENQTGETKIKYLKDDKSLSKAIAQSGLGCGYHYSVGNIGGIPQ